MKQIDLSGVSKVRRGKVREVFDLGDGRLLIVASDRISAFDVVLPNPVPNKGKILNQLSAFWFDRSLDIVPNHMIATDSADFPPMLSRWSELLAGRSMLVRKCRPLPIECVVRGYLAGSGLKEYREDGSVCGVRLPAGLREADELPEPIFTPATKAASGHDENITFEAAAEIVGKKLAERVRDLSLRIYGWAREYARARGIILCDTKFEFGLDGSELYWIDEALTPDSSRFWPADGYCPGQSQSSYDKQFIRDYLETLDWDKKAPGPELPESVIEATADRYLAAFRHLTGRDPQL